MTQDKGILLVDDAPKILEFTQHHLQCCSYRVVTATNGRDALADLERFPIRRLLARRYRKFRALGRFRAYHYRALRIQPSLSDASWRHRG